jgi:hypothetical protein
MSATVSPHLVVYRAQPVFRAQPIAAELRGVDIVAGFIASPAEVGAIAAAIAAARESGKWNIDGLGMAYLRNDKANTQQQRCKQRSVHSFVSSVVDLIPLPKRNETIRVRFRCIGKRSVQFPRRIDEAAECRPLGEDGFHFS